MAHVARERLSAGAGAPERVPSSAHVHEGVAGAAEGPTRPLRRIATPPWRDAGDPDVTAVIDAAARLVRRRVAAGHGRRVGLGRCGEVHLALDMSCQQ